MNNNIIILKRLNNGYIDYSSFDITEDFIREFKDKVEWEHIRRI